ncbi:MAG: C2 family cysteine protease, partial [Phycisphaerae bacterium]|nr:C2 family cysteine protease [Phycisphaerae bacterium]
MKRQQKPIVELLEPRVLLSSTPGLGELLAAAQVLNVPAADSLEVAGVINNGESANVYEFTARASGKMWVEMQAGGSEVDPFLAVLNAKGRRFRRNDNASRRTLDSRLRFSVKAGRTYYVMAEGAEETDGAYTLTLTGDARDDYGNGLETAKELRLRGKGDKRRRGRINYGDDADVFSFVAVKTGMMRVEMESQGRRNTLECDVLIYNSEGELVASGSNGGEGTDSTVVFSATEGESYYIKTVSLNGTTGRYRLRIPGDEHGDRFADGTEVVLNSKGSRRWGGRINYGEDVDMFSIVAGNDGTMNVSMETRGRRNYLNSELLIYDSEGELLDTGSDGGQGFGASFLVRSGQTYSIRAGSEDGSSGKYRMGVVMTEHAVPPPEPPSDGDVGPGDGIMAEVQSLANGLHLLVLGTDWNDVFALSQTGDSMTLASGGNTWTFSGVFSSVSAYGFLGDDVITLDETVSADAWIYAGDGDDTIYASGAGIATLYGGAGDDLLVTVGGGVDMVVGGDGLDSIWSDSSDTLADVSGNELAVGSIHEIAEFYQPYTTNESSASYVSLELRGQDLADPGITSYASGYTNFASSPLFVGEPEYGDANQGYVGDCYFMAALSSLADTDPRLVEQMITPLGDGTYAMRFYKNGSPVYVRIDADLPVRSNGSLVYARAGSDGEMWMPLMEKAYAYFRYGQNSYASLNGGWMDAVFQVVTDSGTARHRTYGSADDLLDYLEEHLDAGNPVTLGTYWYASGPIVGSHAYVVMSVESTDDGEMVTVYNPWGYDGRTWDSNPSDGL